MLPSQRRELQRAPRVVQEQRTIPGVYPRRNRRPRGTSDRAVRPASINSPEVDWSQFSEAEKIGRTNVLLAEIAAIDDADRRERIPGERRRDTESEIVKRADAIMRMWGWLVYGVADSRDATDAGFPDRVYVSNLENPKPDGEPRVWPPVVLFVEWKASKGTTSKRQDIWLNALSHVESTRTFLFRPSDVPMLARWACGLKDIP